ncbi:HNH endonuclease [Hymenobacter sp. HSC-4F20]|nr:HNH endonuclease [Hymenobacter sp. HSC-4F20]
MRKYGARCQCCGRTRKDGVAIQVDHIKPRSRYPKLCLTFSNLQVLCWSCNQGKSNKYADDWR